MNLVKNSRGGYSFLKGIGPYSAGVIALPGYVIEHVRLKLAHPLQAGFTFVKDYLKRIHRPIEALCSMELRSPKPFSFQGFAEFNKEYVQVLESWGIFCDGLNPVARTNVAPALDPPPEAVMFGFSYAVRSDAAAGTFIVAGAGELPEGSLDAADIIRRGETSPAAIEAKASYVLDLMEGRLTGMGLAWRDVTHTSVYTVHDMHRLLPSILGRMGVAQLQGLTRYFARPPVEDIEYEMDLRCCRRELVL